jgi:hypothetical protein
MQEEAERIAGLLEALSLFLADSCKDANSMTALAA